MCLRSLSCHLSAHNRPGCRSAIAIAEEPLTQRGNSRSLWDYQGNQAINYSSASEAATVPMCGQEIFAKWFHIISAAGKFSVPWKCHNRMCFLNGCTLNSWFKQGSLVEGGGGYLAPIGGCITMRKNSICKSTGLQDTLLSHSWGQHANVLCQLHRKSYCSFVRLEETLCAAAQGEKQLVERLQ